MRLIAEAKHSAKTSQFKSIRNKHVCRLYSTQTHTFLKHTKTRMKIENINKSEALIFHNNKRKCRVTAFLILKKLNIISNLKSEQIRDI